MPEKPRSVHPLDPHTSAIGLSRYAIEFLMVAKAAWTNSRPKGGAGFESASVAILYLLGHALELSIKSFLLHRRVPTQQLREKLGHDLAKCLARARKLGFDRMVFELTARELEEFQHLHELYSRKELEYAIGGERRIPRHSVVEAMAERVVFEVARLVARPPVQPKLPT